MNTKHSIASGYCHASKDYARRVWTDAQRVGMFNACERCARGDDPGRKEFRIPVVDKNQMVLFA